MIEALAYIILVYGILSACIFQIQIMNKVTIPRWVALFFKPGTDAIFWVSVYYIKLRFKNGKEI